MTDQIHRPQSRKWVFSERSRGVDVDGLESSFSMRSGSSNEDSVTGAVEMQLGRELTVDERGDEDHGDEKKRRHLQWRMAVIA